MKKLTFLFAFTLCTTLVFGQWISGGGGEIYYNGGNVGIGTSSPALDFELNGNFQIGNNQFFVAKRSDQSQHTVFGMDGFNDFVFNFAGVAEGKSSGLIMGYAGVGKTFDVRFNDGSQQLTYMRILDNGNVGIGTINPTSRLAVNGKILCEEAQVVQDVADYVFEDSYELLSIEELEAFIEDNGHLPNVISQKEVENNEGKLELGDFSVSLLEKIEELTLHVIELNKRVKTLEAENAALKQEDK